MEEETFKFGQQQSCDLVVPSKQSVTPDVAVLSACSADIAFAIDGTDSHAGRNALFTSTSQSESIVECSDNADVARCKNYIYNNLPDSEQALSNGRVVTVVTECSGNVGDRTMFVPENVETAVENPAAYEHIGFTRGEYTNINLDTASTLSEIQTSSKDKNSEIVATTEHVNSAVEEPVKHSNLVAPTHMNSEVQEPVTHSNLEAATSVKHKTSEVLATVEHVNSGEQMILHNESILQTAVYKTTVNNQPSSQDVPPVTDTAPHLSSLLTQIQKQEVDLKQDADCYINPAVHSNNAAHADIFAVENVADRNQDINSNLQEGNYEISRTSEFTKEVESNVIVCVGRDEISVDKLVAEQDSEPASYPILNNNRFHTRNALSGDSSNMDISEPKIISHDQGYMQVKNTKPLGYLENGNSGSQPVSQRKDVDIDAGANVSISENDSSLKDNDKLYKKNYVHADVESRKLGSSVSLNCGASTSEYKHVDTKMVCSLGLNIQNTDHLPVCDNSEDSSLSYTEEFKSTSEDSMLCDSRQQKSLVDSGSDGWGNVDAHLEIQPCAQVKQCDASISQEKCSVFGKDEKQSVSVGEINVALDNIASGEGILEDVSGDNDNLKLCDSVKENNDNCAEDETFYEKSTPGSVETIDTKLSPFGSGDNSTENTDASLGTSESENDDTKSERGNSMGKVVSDEKTEMNWDRLIDNDNTDVNLDKLIDDDKIDMNLDKLIDDDKTDKNLDKLIDDDNIDMNLDKLIDDDKTDKNWDKLLDDDKTDMNLDKLIDDDKTDMNLDKLIDDDKTDKNWDRSIDDDKTDKNLDKLIDDDKIDMNLGKSTDDDKTDMNLDKLIDDDKTDMNLATSVNDEQVNTKLEQTHGFHKVDTKESTSMSHRRTNIEDASTGNREIDEKSTSGGDERIDTTLGDERIDTTVLDERNDTAVGDERTDTTLGDERTDIAVGDERTDTPLSDERTDTTVGDERTDIAVGDERNDIAVGDERTDTTLGDERTNTPLSDERTDTTVGDERTDIAVGDERTDTTVGDERNDTTLGDERTDTTVGDERNDIAVGDERNNTTLGDEKNDTTVVDERTDIAVGDERNDTTLGDERNGTVAGDEKTDTNASIYISDGDDTNFSIYVSDGGDSVVDFITVSDAEEDAHDTPEVAARKLPKLMVILKRCDAGQASLDDHGSETDSSDSLTVTFSPQNRKRSSDGSLIANSGKTQSMEKEKVLDNIVVKAIFKERKLYNSKHLPIARPVTSSNTARKRTTVGREKTTVTREKTAVARKKTTVYPKQFKHSGVYFNQNQKIKRNRYFNLRSLDVTRNLRPKTRLSSKNEKLDVPSGDTLAQEKKKTSTKVKHKPPPESPPLNPTLPFLEVDLDIELDESQFFRPIEPALENTQPAPSQKKKRGRKQRRYKKDSTVSNSSEPSGSNSGEPSGSNSCEPSGSQFTGCDPGHSCCQKTLSAKSDVATQWEDPSRWYAALARANKAMPSHIKTEPGDSNGNLYDPQVTNLQGDQNYKQLNHQYLPEYSYQNTSQDTTMAASANLASNFTEYSYNPQVTNLPENQNYEQLNQQYLPAYSYQNTSQDIKMEAYTPLASAFSEPGVVLGLSGTPLPADAEAIPVGQPRVSSHLFEASSSIPVPVFLTAVHQTSQEFSNSLNSQYNLQSDIHSHSPVTHTNNNFNSWETSSHILENSASSTKDSHTKHKNSSHNLENSSSSTEDLHTKHKRSSDIPENSASSTKDSDRKQKSSDIPENSPSFTKDAPRKRKSSDIPENSPSSTKDVPRKRKKSSNISDNSSSSKKDSHKAASQPDQVKKHTKSKKIGNTKGKLKKKSRKEDDSVVIVIDDAASDSSSDGDVVCIE